jgi:UDPglucose--hexose-1-phosphate uridylyltransferase
MFKKLDEYERENGKCYFCSLEFDDRIIEENDNFVAFCPYDARFSYEMNILPKKHTADFKDFSDEQLYDFGKILKHCLMRLASLYEGISYNICFYNCASDRNESRNMHFFAQIIARIGSMAGFEFSTGCYINSVYPEKAAEVLRNTVIEK